MSRVLEDTFYQLLGVYALAVLLIALGIVGKYALHFQIVAVVIALIGIAAYHEKRDLLSRRTTLWVLLFTLVLFLILRFLPYIGNSVPLGYDPGIYRYVIMHGLEMNDKWVVLNAEPAFMYIMLFMNWFFSADVLLVGVFVFFSGFLGLVMYLCASTYFNRTAGVFAVLLYVLSVVQYQAFWYMYYRNIIGMSLLLLACYCLKRSEKNSVFYWLFVLFGVLLGFVHRPTFYLFGLSYGLYAVVSPWKRKWYDKSILVKNVILGGAILVFVAVGYIGPFWPAISNLVEPVITGFVQPGEGSGTFIDFFTFQFSTLYYLPLSLLGLFYFIRKREFSIVVCWALIAGIIVYFQFFFFNRFIIFLDLVFVLLAGVGFALVVSSGKKLAWLATILLLISGAVFAVHEAWQSKPLISAEELGTIRSLSETPSESYVMSTSSYYSPWIQGYSERRVIAPGLFDYDTHTKEEWSEFWSTNDMAYIKQFMSDYPKEEPLYVYVGPHQKNTIAKFSECFLPWRTGSGGIIYEYVC